MPPSREPELYKDKIEVSLDGRQIFYLFFGGAVIVGMVFVLGVMVGRRVESRSHVDQISRDSARSGSDPLAALDGLESRKLSFQDALGKAPVGTAVESKIDQLEHERGTKSDALPKPALENKPEPKPELKIEPKIEPKPESKVEPPRPAKAEPKPAKADPKPEKADKPDKPEKKKKDRDKETKREERINGDVVTAIDRPVERPELKPEQPKPEKAADKAKFTLQLSSFQDKKEAETFLSSVKSAGYQAYVMEAEVSGKTFYRVRLGRYGSMDAANDAKADVEKALKKNASVMRL